ncbi:MAG: hypothetical protein AB3N23_05650 [Paracoccaceae bacterium]
MTRRNTALATLAFTLGLTLSVATSQAQDTPQRDTLRRIDTSAFLLPEPYEITPVTRRADTSRDAPRFTFSPEGNDRRTWRNADRNAGPRANDTRIRKAHATRSASAESRPRRQSGSAKARR